MSDTIFLQALEVQAILGIQDWERETRQTVRIDLEWPADARSAAQRDDIDATLNYKAIAKRVIAYVESTRFQLVETLAERLAALLIDEYGLEWVRVSVSKPGAIRGAQNVGVRIERHRSGRSA
jgi:7,8-dihydroneopterin aldolase/epimerase/oxygenase